MHPNGFEITSRCEKGSVIRRCHIFCQLQNALEALTLAISYFPLLQIVHQIRLDRTT
jgi:hypothetical protein